MSKAPSQTPFESRLVGHRKLGRDKRWQLRYVLRLGKNMTKACILRCVGIPGLRVDPSRCYAQAWREKLRDNTQETLPCIWIALSACRRRGNGRDGEVVPL